MSWDWLRGWFDVTPYPWTILAAWASASSRWIGFLPLSLRGSRSPLRIDHVREIHMAGHPTADYTGFVCGAGNRGRVVAALAEHVAHHMSWDRLRFEEMNDPDCRSSSRACPAISR